MHPIGFLIMVTFIAGIVAIPLFHLSEKGISLWYVVAAINGSILIVFPAIAITFSRISVMLARRKRSLLSDGQKRLLWKYGKICLLVAGILAGLSLVVGGVVGFYLIFKPNTAVYFGTLLTIFSISIVAYIYELYSNS